MVSWSEPRAWFYSFFFSSLIKKLWRLVPKENNKNFLFANHKVVLNLSLSLKCDIHSTFGYGEQVHSYKLYSIGPKARQTMVQIFLRGPKLCHNRYGLIVACHFPWIRHGRALHVYWVVLFELIIRRSTNCITWTLSCRGMGVVCVRSWMCQWCGWACVLL